MQFSMVGDDVKPCPASNAVPRDLSTGRHPIVDHTEQVNESRGGLVLDAPGSERPEILYGPTV